MGALSFLILLPLIGALALSLLPSEQRLAKIVAMSFGVAELVASVAIAAGLKANTFHFQLEETYSWVPALGIRYHVGIDGVSLWLVPLTALLTVVALVYSLYVDVRAKSFMSLILILEAAMIGSFVSLDLILFFTFFESTLIPMWLLINSWGGARRAYAANKFLIYTFGGSLFMLVSMIALALHMALVTGHPSFDIVEIQAQVANGGFWVNGAQFETLVFWGFALAFLVKSPAFPFHAWIADTYAEAPTAAPILSSAMVKLGTFGFLRFAFPLFPDAVRSQAPILMTLAVIGILYGATVAAVQPDLRRLLAYSSLSHMGFILLGLFSLSYTGVVGGAYQQLNHGVSTAAMFLLVGFLAVRRGSTRFSDLGGLKAQMPIFAALFLVVMLSNVGLPGTNGFIGEFLALLGTFESGYVGAFHLSTGFAIVAGGGVVLAAIYLLYMFQQTFYGPNLNTENRRLRDLKPWEIASVAALGVLIFWGGLYPSTFIQGTESSLQATRMMATNAVGLRPVWADPSLEIDRNGALVRVDANHTLGDPVTPLEQIAPSNVRMDVGAFLAESPQPAQLRLGTARELVGMRR